MVPAQHLVVFRASLDLDHAWTDTVMINDHSIRGGMAEEQ